MYEERFYLRLSLTGLLFTLTNKRKINTKIFTLMAVRSACDIKSKKNNSTAKLTQKNHQGNHPQ